ncbi:lactococcin 972 family bacteriocin [Streptomyces sp. NPDC090077]|uniref:lactococcin 972 family bacteriocin n=1 Tax=Streptomyces sp. NPDC090077 TaxID=3365938 RepID=UPI003821330E
MKTVGRSAAFAITSAALAALSLTTPAAADAPATASSFGASVTVHHRGDGTQPPAELGNPSEWGVVTFRMDAATASFGPQSQACISPSSGGTWCYGWSAREVSPGVVNKYCYSNYLHGSKGHSSTVKLAGDTRRAWAPAGGTSNANLTAGLAYTCSSYYSVD